MPLFESQTKQANRLSVPHFAGFETREGGRRKPSDEASGRFNLLHVGDGRLDAGSKRRGDETTESSRDARPIPTRPVIILNTCQGYAYDGDIARCASGEREG